MNWQRLMFWRNEPTEHAQKGAEIIELQAQSNHVLQRAKAAEKLAKHRLSSYGRVSIRR